MLDPSAPVRNLVQYHLPSVMGTGVDEAGSSPFTVYSRKAFDDGIGSVVWLVGQKQEPGRHWYLRRWFVVDEIVGSDHRAFTYRYRGQHGAYLEPMPAVGDATWFRLIVAATGNFQYGLSSLQRHDAAVRGLMS